MTAVLKAVHLEDPIAGHVREILKHLKENPGREGLARTPERYAKAMRFLAGGYAGSVETVVGNGVFAAEGEGAVVVRDIDFLCMAMRGVQKQHSSTTTQARRGSFEQLLPMIKGN